MKKMLKSPMFMFILGAIIFSGIGVCASSILSANEIAFTPTNEEWKVENVEEAINDLYTSLDSSTNLTYVGVVKGGFNQGTSAKTITLSKQLNSGKYLVIISISATDSSSTTDVSNTTSSAGTLSGCSEQNNLFFSSYGKYYNTTSTYANQWLNIKTCTLTSTTTLQYTRTVNDDNNIVVSFFKIN